MVKKKGVLNMEQKREAIEKNNSDIPICRQCYLLDLSLSSFYYQAAGESELNRECMRLIDEQYEKCPFYGYRKMEVMLWEKGYEVNHKRVRRLMELMGLKALYPKKKGLSISNEYNPKYCYLLDDIKIDTPNRVWTTDITYVKVGGKNYYLMAVMDWYSRYVISWGILKRMDADSCVEVLKRALEVTEPDIFNSDQGSQFTSRSFIDMLKKRGIAISMDGKGRCFDNIIIERFWRTVKYEEIYLKEYNSYFELKESLKKYIDFYNQERYHQSLRYLTPATVYFGNTEMPLNHLNCA
jgi:putative transposase